MRQFRHLFRVSLNIPSGRESCVPEPYIMHAAKLVQSLGYWGGANIEMKIDARDGVAKLMEINPRLAYALWARVELGINEPLICLKIAREEEVVGIKEYPVGTMLLDPVEDFLGLGVRFLDRMVYKFRIGMQRKAPIDPLNAPMALKELFRSYLQSYFTNKKRAFNPYFKYFFRDPVVSVLWWLQFSILMMRGLKQLGR